MSESHFPWLHNHKGASFGPFGFLNPTLRRYPLQFDKSERHSSDEQLQGKKEGETGDTTTDQLPAKKKDEIRAEDVQRKWRSRDNRKGKSFLVCIL